MDRPSAAFRRRGAPAGTLHGPWTALALAASLASTGVAGCVANEVGPAVRCLDCAPVLEPGGAAHFTTEWFDEPCDSDSRTAGPLVRYCTEIDIDRAVSCEGRCDVEQDEVDPARVAIRAREEGPMAVEVTLTRRDTAERHVEVHSFDVAFADALILRCETELDSGACRRRTRAGGGDYFTLEVRATSAGRPVALDLAGLTGVQRSREVGVGVYEGTVDVGPGASEVTVRSAGGVSATIALPAS